MLQDIRRKKIGKSGSKFRHEGGGYQKQPKQFRCLVWTALNENIKTGVFRGMIKFKNSLLWHFNLRFVLKTTETPVFMFSLLRFLTNL